MATSMSAVRVHAFGGTEVLQLDTSLAIPVPSANQILIRVEAAGVNPVETYIRQGAYARLPQLPYTPGSEGAGTVAALGAEVDGLREGDRVYFFNSTGSYAQYTLCQRHEARALPQHLSFEQGAAIGIAYRTAYRALFQRTTTLPGHLVLVHGGSGAVGVAAIQLAKAHGAKVIATAGTPEGCALLRKQGAVATFNHRDASYLEQMAEYARPHGGVNVIVEMLANVNLQADLELLAQGGTVAVVGNRGTININPRTIMLKETQVVGVLGGTPREWEQAYDAIDAGLQSTALQPLVGATYPLAQVQEAHQEVIEHRQGSSGKIVLLPWV